MTRFEFEPKWVFFEFVPCAFIERCGKENLYPYKHPTAPDHRKLFAKGLCASCYFFLSNWSNKTTCADPDCNHFIIKQRSLPGIPSRFTTRARGLCTPCWQRHYHNGTLDQFEKLGHGWTQEQLETIRRMRSHGCTRKLIASETGLSVSMVDWLVRQNSIPRGSSESRAA